MSLDANVTICSPLRDAGKNFPAYLARLQALTYPPERLRFVCVEGDSVDDTWAQLTRWQVADNRVTLRQCDLHQPRFGSIVNAERFRVLATVFNAALTAVDYAWSDYVLFLPCDIDYRPGLLEPLVAWRLDVLAPFSYQDGWFYDVWAFCQNGRNFGKFTELQAFYHFGDRPVQLDSVGGTVLLSKALLAAGCRYTEDAVDRGLCAQARAQGFTVWAHPGVQVYHPPYEAWHG